MAAGRCTSVANEAIGAFGVGLLGRCAIEANDEGADDLATIAGAERDISVEKAEGANLPKALKADAITAVVGGLAAAGSALVGGTAGTALPPLTGTALAASIAALLATGTMLPADTCAALPAAVFKAKGRATVTRGAAGCGLKAGLLSEAGCGTGLPESVVFAPVALSAASASGTRAARVAPDEVDARFAAGAVKDEGGGGGADSGGGGGAKSAARGSGGDKAGCKTLGSTNSGFRF
jgi:hypothetical protein